MKQFPLLFCLLLCAACTRPPVVQALPTVPPLPTITPAYSIHTAQPIEPTVTPGDPTTEVLARAAQVVLLLQAGDLDGLSELTHRYLGIRFSPYATILPDDRIFLKEQLPVMFDDPTVYHWGTYAGSGAPIDLTFAEYFAEFVYDVDFANAPQIALNQRLGPSTTLDNSAEVYADKMIVDYHFPGFDPQYEGLDWRSLRLVFKYCQGSYDLIGIIHDEWTP